MYRSRIAELTNHPHLVAELELTANISARVATLFTKTGLPITADSIEPLQVMSHEP